MVQALVAAIDACLGSHVLPRMGVAVSGGGDSVALLIALAEVAEGRGTQLHVVTVDHGLRPEAKEEIRLVTGLCQTLGLSHHVEYWSGWDGTGNLQARAREARYRLISDWAVGNGIGHVALGHTCDDQAETVLMRLARLGGVDGLSGMPARHVRRGITWLRPFLGLRRAELRECLREKGIAWADDPSNDDTRFERVRMRQALDVLEPLGISAEVLGQAAEQFADARAALDWQAFLAARDIVQVHHGAIAFDLKTLRALPVEIRRRLLVRGTGWLTGHDYPPRRDAVAGALQAVRDGASFTFDGCQITVRKDLLWLHRELAAVQHLTAEPGATWDDRWQLIGPEADPTLEVRALGTDILPSLDGWRDMGLPRAAMAVTPALWRGGELVAAPIAQPGGPWRAWVPTGEDAFFAALLSH